jgi:hypothetical protein
LAPGLRNPRLPYDSGVLVHRDAAA